MATGGIYRIVKNPENPYVIVDKGFVNNPELSWKAKGILLYLLSKPDNWQVYGQDIVKHSTEGRDAVASGIAELIKHGHIKREVKRDEQGRLDGYNYDVYEVPHRCGKTVTGSAEIGLADTTNNDLELSNEVTNSNMSSSKNSKKIPYKEIVDFLNTHSGKKYRHTTAPTQRLIKARFNDGFTLEDFKTVIRGRCAKWKGTHLAEYMRPETLFGTKFEGYLNDTEASPLRNGLTILE